MRERSEGRREGQREGGREGQNNEQTGMLDMSIFTVVGEPRIPGFRSYMERSALICSNTTLCHKMIL